MPSESLTLLTKNPVVSSAGASLSGSTSQWNPVPFDITSITTTTEEYPHLLLSWQQEVPGGLFIHQCSRLAQMSESEAAHNLPNLQYRCFSHAVIDLLPDRALAELIQTLKALIEFYSAPESPATLPPAPLEARAKVGETYIRPSFQITED